MKSAINILKILLLIIALLMIFSFSLPIVNSFGGVGQLEEKPPFLVQDSLGYFFDAFPNGYNFGAIHIIIPIAAIVCMFLTFKYSDYIACSLFFTSAALNALLFLRFVSDINTEYYKTEYGLTMNFILSILIALFALVLLIFTIAERRQKVIKENIDSVNTNFVEQLRKLDFYKKQGFLTEEEYAEKREQILKDTLN